MPEDPKPIGPESESIGKRTAALTEHADAVLEVRERHRRCRLEMIAHEVRLMVFDGLLPALAEVAAKEDGTESPPPGFPPAEQDLKNARIRHEIAERQEAECVACRRVARLQSNGGPLLNGYEAGFGAMLLEPYPTHGFEHQGCFRQTRRDSTKR